MKNFPRNHSDCIDCANKIKRTRTLTKRMETLSQEPTNYKDKGLVLESAHKLTVKNIFSNEDLAKRCLNSERI